MFLMDKNLGMCLPRITTLKQSDKSILFDGITYAEVLSGKIECFMNVFLSLSL